MDYTARAGANIAETFYRAKSIAIFINKNIFQDDNGYRKRNA